MWKENKLLLSTVLLFCTLSNAQMQVAPGDEDSSCVRQNPAEPDNVKVLMNSRNYEQLLGVQGAVWDQRDFDDNNPPNPYNPTFFRHNAGGLCRWSVMSCGYREGHQDNWLFTQYIDKSAPANTNYNVKLIIDMSYTVSNCRTRHNCNPEIAVYIFNTTRPQEREVYTDPVNYKLLNETRGASFLTKTMHLEVEVPPSVAGFYIAVHDDRSCVTVAQLKVFRYQCKTKQVGLVVFPETAAPVEHDLPVTTSCNPHSSPITDLTVTCDSTGHWSGSATCVCDPGYKKVLDSDRNYFCEPCPAGTYRSASDPEDECKPCPANTSVDVVAAPICECLTGFFRNTEGLDEDCPDPQSYEDASYDCTKPPSMPINLRSTEVTRSAISISWTRPIFDGIRNDMYYTVQYSDPDNVGEFLDAECDGSVCLRVDECTIAGLNAATTYVIRVTAHNGVSDQDKGGALARQKEITIMTAIAPPSPPQNVTAFCDVIVWNEPISTNGDIIRYEIMFTFSDGSTITVEVVGSCFYIIVIVLPPGPIWIKVRAVNKAGPGPWSDLVHIHCSDSTTSTISASPSTVTQTALCTVTATPTPCATPPPTVVTAPALADCSPPTAPTLPPCDACDSCCEECQPTTELCASCPTPECPVAWTCPECPEPTCPTPPEITLPGRVEHTSVLCCGTIGWLPPRNTGGDIRHYIIRFFTGDSWETTDVSERQIQYFYFSPDRRFAKAAILPSDCNTRLYAQIKVGNSAGMADYSDKFVVADADLCCHDCECEPCDSCCEECDECTCPTVTCPTCPSIATSDTASTSPNTPTTPSSPSPCSDPNRKPGNVVNVNRPACGVIEWDVPNDETDCNEDITYKFRVYSGPSWGETDPGERKVFSTDTNSLTFTAADVPSGRPLYAIVKARRSNGLHSRDWSAPIIVSYSLNC